MWKSYYSIGEFWKNIINIVYTRIFWRGARFIRRPIHVRNKKNIRYGRNFTTGYWNRLNVMGKLLIGDDVILGDFAQIEAFSKVEIGDGTLIASRVFIGYTSHGIYKGETASDIEIPPNKREIVSEDIHIGKNVWIGENVSILQGVSLGDGCIVGANSVVTRSFPEGCMLVGSPAKIIKRYNDKTKQWEKDKGNE